MNRMFTTLTHEALPAVLTLMQQLASRGPVRFTSFDWNVPVERDMTCHYGQGGIECEFAGSVSTAILPSSREVQTFYRVVDGVIEFEIIITGASHGPLRHRFEPAS